MSVGSMMQYLRERCDLLLGHCLHTLLSDPCWYIGLEICMCVGGTEGTALIFTAGICLPELSDVSLREAKLPTNLWEEMAACRSI